MLNYIIGFFDADGSITMSKNNKTDKYKTIKIDFTNVEINILLEIQEFLMNYNIKSYITTKPAKKPSHQTSYALSVSSNQMCYKLCELLKNSKHPKKKHRINTILKYHNLVTNKNGKYNAREHMRKLAYERLFFSPSFH